jgi:hypothetical protein
MKAFSSISKPGRGAVRKVAQLVAFSMLLLTGLPLFAQTNQGTIQGGVYDQSGGAIVGAKVTVLDVARGISRVFTTDSAGQYVAVNLTPGMYTVRGEDIGFQNLEHANVLVEVGENVRVDLTLQPGAQTQTVTVNSEAAQIDTTDAVLGGTISNQEMNALPLNGRSFLKLLDLRPGSVIEIGGTEGAGQTNNTSFNGLRVQDNLFLVEGLPQFSPDGQPIVNQSLGGPGSILSIDAIQEFNTEANPKAEFGWKDGGIVDIGIKSGTNSLHGTAFAFGRDGAWDAGNYFTGAVPVELEQFGGTVGGHIIKDKLFWFTDFEGQRYTVGVPATPSVPSDVAMSSAVDPQNELSMVNACNALGRAKVAALSAELAGLPAGSCVPQPASSTFENVFPFISSSTSNTYVPGFSNVVSIYGGLAKGDYQINGHNHVDGMYYRSRQASTSYTTAAIAPQWSSLVPLDVLMYSGSWTWTPKSNLVNEFRAGYAVVHAVRAGGDNTQLVSNQWPSGYGMNTGVTNPLYGGLPIIKIGGFTGQLGVGTASGVRGPEGNYDFIDHVSYLRGKHAFKFGLDYMYQLFHGDTYKNASGTINFANLQAFLTGSAKSANLLVGNPALSAGSHNFGAFAQDDWRVTTRLTLNLGLRWEYYASPNEAHNYIGNFYPNVNPATTSAIQQAGGPFPKLFKPDPWQFSPRVGVAWDVRGNGKTVVRAAGSLLYNIPVIGDDIDSIPFGASFLNPALGLNINNSGTDISAHNATMFAVNVKSNQFNWSLAGPVFPVAAPQTINGITYTGQVCDPASPCDPIAVNPNMKAPRTAEWNVDIERAITSSLTVDIAYVGNHQFDGLSRNNINQPPLGAGWNNPNPSLGMSPAAACIAVVKNCTSSAVTGAVAANELAASTYPQFPYLQYITYQSNQYYSNYNALQVTASERAAHGLTFVAGFTHDNSLDFTTSGGWGGPFNQDSHHVAYDYGASNLDVLNRFTFSTTYSLPQKTSPLQLLQGWAVNGIVVLQGGLRWTPQDMTSDLEGTGEYADPNSPAGQFWNYSGPSSAFTSGPHTIPCFGNLPGCAAYVGGPPTACVNAVQAAYPSNAQLQSLAMAALTNLGCYVQGGGVLTPPAYGTVGNATRGIFRARPFYNLDFSISKDWKFRERYTAQFRAEFFNAFNHPNFAQPSVLDPEKGNSPGVCSGFGGSCSTPDAQGGDPVLGAGGPRAIQLGLKLIF